MTQPLFSASVTDGDLLSAVGDVATSLRSAEPGLLTMREWDTRRADAGYADLPSARAITQRFGLGWPAVVAAACRPQRRHLADTARRATGTGRTGLTLDHAVLAARRAAIRLGADTITRAQYGEARAAIIKDAGRVARAAAQASMPDLPQLDGVLRRAGLSWADLLEQAGLSPPDVAAAAMRSRGLDAAGALAAFVEQMDALPTSATHLRDWGREHQVATARWPAGTYAAALASVKAERAAAGLADLPIADRQDLGRRPSPSKAGTSLPTGRRGRWDRDGIVEGLARVIARLPPTRTLRRADLRDHALGDPAVPHTSAVARWLAAHPEDSWQALRKEAEALAAGR